MARQLFGTDGIRGVAGEPPLDPPTVFGVGLALGQWAVAAHGPSSEVLLGIDTRESSPWIAETLAAGLLEQGARIRFAGVITTPGVAFLTKTMDFVAGVMISASHNPFRDNGIKIFDHSGFKLPDEVEHSLEQIIFEVSPPGEQAPRISLAVDEGLDRAYVDYLANSFCGSLQGRRLLVDCANGAASHLAPELFRRLGAEVEPRACEPDGRNINLNCGALYVEQLVAEVIRSRANVGIAFDGDADRAMLVSESGKVVDGDAILLLSAKALLSKGLLGDSSGRPTVVATVMSNYGLEQALHQLGIRLLRTSVGDKYVLEEMLRQGAVLGGEQSGHVIFRRYATTGDGLLTALRVLEVMVETGQTLDELTQDLKVYPQTLVNVPVRQKRPIDEIPPVQQEIAAAMQEFAGAGRVLVRFSGTEPVARVMVEGPDTERVERFARRIAEAVGRELGA
ncbi:MAG: phosphoglucosamine mutase [Bryobacteraceae bacterium]|nr:phosphoglucosamine mutase [Bryobacteraceae bacterium]MDW8377379.1 phosphoglucosamine mutase [Bryobacterales bacterium]